MKQHFSFTIQIAVHGFCRQRCLNNDSSQRPETIPLCVPHVGMNATVTIQRQMALAGLRPPQKSDPFSYHWKCVVVVHMHRMITDLQCWKVSDIRKKGDTLKSTAVALLHLFPSLKRGPGHNYYLFFCKLK